MIDEPDAALERPGFLTLVAILDALGGGVVLLVALALFASFANDGGPVVLALGAGALLLAVGHVAGGYGLARLRPWSRVVQMGLAMTWLPFFPLGTVMGIMLLIYLTRPGARLILAGRSEQELGPEDRERLARLPKTAQTAIVAFVVSLLLAVMAIPFAGIIAAIAIPNFLSAIQRSKQKRTMADMHSLAIAIESYAADHRIYPAAASLDEAEPLLVPEYIRMIPRTDGWQRPIKLVVWDAQAPSRLTTKQLRRTIRAPETAPTPRATLPREERDGG